MPVSAAKAIRRAAESGEPLPMPAVLRGLRAAGGTFRRGHLVLVAALPNAGKSAWVQWLAAEANVKTLYFSADQDAWTATTRLAATLTGNTTHDAALAISEQGDPEEKAFYLDALSRSNLSFCFDSNPSIDDLLVELDAYVDLWDEFPEMIVIDNLINLEGSGEHEGDQYLMGELHGLARNTKACVVIVAHASESTVSDVSRPPRRKDIINKLGKLPDLIVTLALDEQTSRFLLAVVKTREAKADPNALRPLPLDSDFSRMTFFEPAGWGYQQPA